jgi:FKBP-type peptidyl-prolyl cis-trans isomerase FklB
MKLQLIAVLAVVLLTSQVNAQEKQVLKDEKDKISYSIGINMGNSFKNQTIDVNPDLIAQGIKDVFSGGQTLMTEQEVRDTLTALQKEIAAKNAERIKEIAEKNKKEGEEFLAENKKKEGVITTPSGLQYKVIKEGDGEIPKLADTVTVNYRGTLVNGTEFDSSYKRGKPATFPVNGVIAGWSEALQLMKVGSEWQLFIPSNLAYAERGAGQAIGPNSTLIFDVELLSIKGSNEKGEEGKE